MSNYEIYLIEATAVAIGLTFMAYRMNASPLWISLGLLSIIALCTIAAVSKTREKEVFEARHED